MQATSGQLESSRSFGVGRGVLGTARSLTSRGGDKKFKGEAADIHKEFANGDRYVGKLSGGIPHGFGKYTWKDGSMYEGEWVKGNKDGKGLFQWPSGARYVGEWTMGTMQGVGSYEGVDGSFYTGNWAASTKHGLGRKRYPNGDLYEGFWSRGAAEGPGRYNWVNGNEYVGEWRAGTMSGFGTFTWAGGDSYAGDWESGYEHGHGLFTWADGACYEGTWSRGLKDGRGVYYPVGTQKLTSHDFEGPHETPRGEHKGDAHALSKQSNGAEMEAWKESLPQQQPQQQASQQRKQQHQTWLKDTLEVWRKGRSLSLSTSAKGEIEDSKLAIEKQLLEGARQLDEKLGPRETEFWLGQRRSGGVRSGPLLGFIPSSETISHRDRYKSGPLILPQYPSPKEAAPTWGQGEEEDRSPSAPSEGSWSGSRRRRADLFSPKNKPVGAGEGDDRGYSLQNSPSFLKLQALVDSEGKNSQEAEVDGSEAVKNRDNELDEAEDDSIEQNDLPPSKRPNTPMRDFAKYNRMASFGDAERMGLDRGSVDLEGIDLNYDEFSDPDLESAGPPPSLPVRRGRSRWDVGAMHSSGKLEISPRNVYGKSSKVWATGRRPESSNNGCDWREFDCAAGNGEEAHSGVLNGDAGQHSLASCSCALDGANRGQSAEGSGSYYPRPGSPASPSRELTEMEREQVASRSSQQEVDVSSQKFSPLDHLSESSLNRLTNFAVSPRRSISSLSSPRHRLPGSGTSSGTATPSQTRRNSFMGVLNGSGGGTLLKSMSDVARPRKAIHLHTSPSLDKSNSARSPRGGLLSPLAHQDDAAKCLRAERTSESNALLRSGPSLQVTSSQTPSSGQVAPITRNAVVVREYVQGLLVSENLRDSTDTRPKRRNPQMARLLPGEKIYKGHRSYDLMLALQLGLWYTVGKVTPEPVRPIVSSDFAGNKGSTILMGLSKEDMPNSPFHPAKPFNWKDYCPMVFRHLRDIFRIDASDYMLSLCGNDALRELSSPGKSGSVFFLSQDGRFMVKTLRKSEVKVLLRMLPAYFEHICKHQDTLLTKMFGLHQLRLHRGAKVRFVVMANLFKSDLRIHRRWDLKGSSQGRSTDKIQIDESTTLKDLDLDLAFHLHDGKREAVLSQIAEDCKFLESQHIMDYSLLLGCHFRATNPPPPLVTLSDLDSGQEEKLEEPLAEHYERSVNGVATPSLVSPGAYRDGTWGAIGHAGECYPFKRRPDGSVLGQDMEATAVRLDRRTLQPILDPQLAEAYEVVVFFGIIDILQSYDVHKKAEHFVKALQYDGTSISAVNPHLYAKRFQKFTRLIFPDPKGQKA